MLKLFAEFRVEESNGMGVGESKIFTEALMGLEIEERGEFEAFGELRRSLYTGNGENGTEESELSLVGFTFH